MPVGGYRQISANATISHRYPGLHDDIPRIWHMRRRSSQQWAARAVSRQPRRSDRNHTPACATIYATRNTHQRLSALSVVPTGSYLPYQCSLHPVPVVAVLTFRGTYFTFSIFTNPDSEDALCEVLQIDEIPALRTTDPPPPPTKKTRFRTASASKLIPFESQCLLYISISQRKVAISEMFRTISEKLRRECKSKILLRPHESVRTNEVSPHR